MADGRCELRITRRYDASPAEVWKAMSDLDMMIVHVIMPKAEEAAAAAEPVAAAAATAAEPEVIKKGKKEEAEEKE